MSAAAREISEKNLTRRLDVGESELGSLAETLNQTFARLDAAFQRQVRFTADASHELRTPVSVVHSQAELALARPRTAEEYKQTIESCLRASKRMKALVESLLVLARADAGGLELARGPVDLAAVVRESVALLEPLATERKIVVETELAPVTLDGDRTRLGQVVTNLVANAIRYNVDAGRVRVTLVSTVEESVLSVADTGIGIAAEQHPRVFERFFRADEARASGGTGLGLAICRSIVLAHGGSIDFTSAPGAGTTFTVRLPR
jgi:heavy metal sensor kinase